MTMAPVAPALAFLRSATWHCPNGHRERAYHPRPPATSNEALFAAIVFTLFGLAGLVYGIVVLTTQTPAELAVVTQARRGLTLSAAGWAGLGLLEGLAFTTGAVISFRLWWQRRR